MTTAIVTSRTSTINRGADGGGSFLGWFRADGRRREGGAGRARTARGGAGGGEKPPLGIRPRSGGVTTASRDRPRRRDSRSAEPGRSPRIVSLVSSASRPRNNIARPHFTRITPQRRNCVRPSTSRWSNSVKLSAPVTCVPRPVCVPRARLAFVTATIASHIRLLLSEDFTGTDVLRDVSLRAHEPRDVAPPPPPLKIGRATEFGSPLAPSPATFYGSIDSRAPSSEGRKGIRQIVLEASMEDCRGRNGAKPGAAVPARGDAETVRKLSAADHAQVPLMQVSLHNAWSAFALVIYAGAGTRERTSSLGPFAARRPAGRQGWATARRRSRSTLSPAGDCAGGRHLALHRAPMTRPIRSPGCGFARAANLKAAKRRRASSFSLPLPRPLVTVYLSFARLPVSYIDFGTNIITGCRRRAAAPNLPGAYNTSTRVQLLRFISLSPAFMICDYNSLLNSTSPAWFFSNVITRVVLHTPTLYLNFHCPLGRLRLIIFYVR